jgi:hypothetical protein
MSVALRKPVIKLRGAFVIMRIIISPCPVRPVRYLYQDWLLSKDFFRRALELKQGHAHRSSPVMPDPQSCYFNSFIEKCKKKSRRQTNCSRRNNDKALTLYPPFLRRLSIVWIWERGRNWMHLIRENHQQGETTDYHCCSTAGNSHNNSCLISVTVFFYRKSVL